MMRNLWLGMLLVSSAAWGGNELGNGGDTYAQEFVALGRGIAAKLKAEPNPKIAEIDALSKAVEETKVTTLDKVELAGAEVDAVNYPESRKIEVNRSRWKQYNAEEKASLVLHEYLGIAKVEDSRYEVSGEYSQAYAEVFSEYNSQRKFFVGLGSGSYAFTGNAGKIFGSSIPGLEFRVGALVFPNLVVQIEGSQNNFSFTAIPNGRVDMRLLRASLVPQFHFLSSKAWRTQRGFDPYLLGAFGFTFRDQVFQSINKSEKDNAMEITAGIGANYFIVPKRSAIWLEGRASKIYFKDRYEETYLDSGLEDTTGNLLAATAGVQLFF